MSRAQQLEALHALALLIGLRAAARKLGINEKTACTIAARNKWELSKVDGLAPLRAPRPATKSHVGQNATDLLSTSLREASDDSRLYLSAAVLKASHAAAASQGDALLKQGTSIALLNTARTGDITHGWTAERAKPAQVNVAVVMPTPEQDAERQAAHDALDAITAKLLAE
jgi:hypothetical protein